MNADLLKGFYLGDLLVEPAKRRVTCRQGSERLSPKATEVLLCLARRPGELVTREELLDCAWGEQRGSREAVSHAVSEIRQALKDNRDHPAFIQTLPRRGYRLLVTPTPASGDTGTIVFGANNGVGPDELGLFENLKQRGVLETGLAYLVLGWLLIQVADIVFDQLLLPRWAGTFVTVLVIAGFPIALVLSWFLEFRDGNAVLDELSPRDARRRRFGRTYLSVVSALAIAAVAVFLYDQSIGLPVEDAPAMPAAALDPALPPVLENSIAVLPFLNLDGSEETQVFANGLVDDVITRLSRVPGLLVSSRGDAFTLAPNSPSEQVRDRLRVAMYLEGSVQSAGDELRVIVQMIDSETGFHILSRSFDRPRADFFDIRDEITELTVANVRVALPSSTQVASPMDPDTPSLDAYLLYRRGVDAANAPGADAGDIAVSWFNAALGVDPEYGAAHAGICTVLVGNYFESSDTDQIKAAESSCFRALELNPTLDVVHIALGNLYQATGRQDAAITSYREALRINPSSVSAMTGLGGVLAQSNEPGEAEQLLRRAVGMQPGNWSAYNALGAFLFNAGRYEEAAEQYKRVVALDRDNMVGFSNLGTAHMLAGNFAEAAPALRQSIDIEPRAQTYSSLGLMLYYLGDLDAAVAAHRNAIGLAPNDPLMWSNLGDALWIAGRSREATSAFESAQDLALKALDVNPNDPYTQMDLAWISTMLGEHEEARRLIEAASLQAPDDPYADYIDGLVHLAAGDADAALAALQAAADKGYSLEMMAAEPHLAPLQSNPGFIRLTEPGAPR